MSQSLSLHLPGMISRLISSDVSIARFNKIGRKIPSIERSSDNFHSGILPFFIIREEQISNYLCHKRNVVLSGNNFVFVGLRAAPETSNRSEAPRGVSHRCACALRHRDPTQNKRAFSMKETREARNHQGNCRIRDATLFQ